MLLSLSIVFLILLFQLYFSSIHYCGLYLCFEQIAVVQLLSPTLCHLMDCSMPGFSVLHCLPEFAQILVHWLGDAVQPSHPLLPPLLLPSVFPSITVFSTESALPIRWPKYWSFCFSISPSNEYSGLISFRINWLDLLAVQMTYQEFSLAPQFENSNS